MKSILAVAFPLLIFGLFVASIWYLAYRLRILFGLERRWPLRIVIAVGVFASMAGMLSGARSTSAMLGGVNVASGYVFSFYVFLLLLLLVMHAALWKVRRPRSRQWVAAAALSVALGLTVAGALGANPFGVRETVIRLDGLKEELVVVQLSDVHIGHHRGRAYLAEIVARTNQLRPDVVLITGDLVDSDAALLPGVLSPLSRLDALAFFVGGNHDNYVDTERALKLIAEHGVRVLHNEIVATHGIYLVGLDYMNPDEATFDMHPSEDKRTIKSVLPTLSLPNDKPAVLMHHSPVGTQYMSAKGIDLIVAGHTHGGQMFPGTLFAPLIFPFNKGLYRRGSLQVFVSQGAGTFGPRMRLGTSNEINLLRLKAGPVRSRAGQRR